MELNLSQALQIAAGINAVAAVLLSFRALQARAGLWAVLLGLELAVACASLAFFQQGFERLAYVWWVSWVLLPALVLPLSIAVANIGLLRQVLSFCNAVLLLLAMGGALWFARELQWLDASWGRDLRVPPLAILLCAWAGAVWLAAVLDTALQWARRSKARERQRMGMLLFVLLAMGLGWALDALWFMGQGGLGPWGFVATTLGYLVLFVTLWVQRGPRRISGSVTPAILQASKQAILIADGEGRIQAANAAAIRLLDRRRYQVLGGELSKVLGLDIDYLDTATRLHGAGYVERIHVDVRSANAVREVAVQPLVLRADDGEVLAVICTLNPGSEDPALAATSLHDPVTQLAGAALGEALIAQELRRHAGGSGPLVAAVFARLDDAGVIASRHGQALHDRLQNAVAERLAAVCDWPLDLARTAGGGYLMLLTQVNDREEVLSIAQRAHEMLSQPYKLDQEVLQPPVLVTVMPDLRVYSELIDVLTDARHGLSRARHAPHEPFVTEQRAKERVNLALALEAAIATDALDIRLEPVVDLRNERAVGLRARAQWAPEGMPTLHDDELRRLARRVHLEGPLNQWRLRAVARLKYPKAWAIWLPVDLEELQAPGFTRAFPKALTQLPFKLMLELPDAAWLLPASRKVANDLVAAGMGLHAADFSRGAKLVTHAAGLIPRTAKLEARLVQTHSPAADAAVAGLVATAQVLGMALRGDGVRKKKDIQRLRSLGVALASGEFIGPEMTPEEFLIWLEDETSLRHKLSGTAGAVVPSPRERRGPTLD